MMMSSLALVFGSGGTLQLARCPRHGWGSSGLLRVGLTDLQRKTGVGPARASQLKAALELGRRALVAGPLGHQVLSAADMADCCNLSSDRLSRRPCTSSDSMHATAFAAVTLRP